MGHRASIAAATALGLVASGSGQSKAPVQTVDQPSCGSTRNDPRTDAERNRDALAAIGADALITHVRGSWHVFLIGPATFPCPDGRILRGTSVVITFDNAQDLTWNEDGVACVNGEGQPTRFQMAWHSLRTAKAEVWSAKGPVTWSEAPPPDINHQPTVTTTPVMTLGPRAGPCPKPLND